MNDDEIEIKDEIIEELIKDAKRKKRNWALWSCGNFSMWKKGKESVVGGGKVCPLHGCRKLAGETYE